jgi:hypothetical protein
VLRRVPKRFPRRSQVTATEGVELGTESHHQEREVRAARNQALFRAVNEKMRKLNEDVASLTGSFTIACECADTNCLEMIEISTDDYLAVRGEPRRFVVLPGHVIVDVETVLREGDTYAVVEKKETAAQVAELLAPESG